jgi:hypothetical protein
MRGHGRRIEADAGGGFALWLTLYLEPRGEIHQDVERGGEPRARRRLAPSNSSHRSPTLSENTAPSCPGLRKPRVGGTRPLMARPEGVVRYYSTSTVCRARGR